MDEFQHSENEQQLFEALDRYFTARSTVSRENAEPSAELEESFPDLAGMRECIDKLQLLAAEASNPNSAIAPDEAATSEQVRHFGRYEIVREIGRGGMGIVFEARHTELNSSVALKVVRSGQFASPDEIERFYTEARTASRLRHPGIVSVHDVGEWQGEHFLTMDLVEGPSLADLLRQDGPLEVRRAAEMVATIARAVSYLHDQGVIHRDLKPSNIILDENGDPHVTDLGLARVFEGDSRKTATGMVIGTASYMPPEQAAGRTREVSVRSDVYSLGAILYEMLTGRPPFQEDNQIDTLLQVMEATPEPIRRYVETVPAELETICMACLEKAPEDRLESAEQVAGELERFLREEPIHIKPRSWWERLKRWTRREPALASRLAIVAAGACVVEANYRMANDLIALDEHLRVMVVIVGWALTCIVCQKLMNLQSWERRMPYVWAVTDVFFLTTLLILARPGRSMGPALIGYPLLVVASGLWFEVRLVWLMTALSTLGYLVVNLMREPLHPDAQPPGHYPYIYTVVLCGIGYIVAYQVERIRALSRYFERSR